ncbi:hypothetical protein [Rhodococcus qingshengii]|uniref:hypothetical protein n=1 Tax=Rhodococcus qingshengii TaxID=334542 RepID=UPI00301968B6
MTSTRTPDELSEIAEKLLNEGIKDLERKYYGEAQAKFLGSNAAATLALVRSRTG